MKPAPGSPETFSRAGEGVDSSRLAAPCAWLTRTALLAALVFSPLAWGAVEGWSVSLVHFLTLVALCAWLARMNAEGSWRWVRTPLDLPGLALCLWALVALAASPSPSQGVPQLWRLVNYGVVYGLVVNGFDTRERLGRLCWVVVGMGVFLSLIGFAQYSGGIHGPLAATYVNPNHFAGYLEMTMPVGLGLWLATWERSQRVILGYGVVVMLVAAALTFSRGGWAGLVISLAWMTLLLKKKRVCEEESPKRGWALPLALAAVTGLFLLAFGLHSLLKEAATVRKLAGEGVGYDFRIQVWQGTLALIADHPLWGTGPGTYLSSFPLYRPAGLDYQIDYAHNDYLQVAAEMGLPALAALLGLMGTALWVGARTFLRTRSSFKGGLALGATGGIAALAVHSVVDFGLQVPANALLFAVLLGVVARCGMKT